MIWNLHIHCLFAISLALSAAFELALDQNDAWHGSAGVELAAIGGGRAR